MHGGQQSSPRQLRVPEVGDVKVNNSLIQKGDEKRIVRQMAYGSSCLASVH